MKESNSVNIFICGDYAPQLRVNEFIQAKKYKKIFNDILSIIQEADFSITNLELPLIDEGTPIKKTGPNIKAPTDSINALKFAGFSLVTLANNHIMDYGLKGLSSTIKKCIEAGIDYTGAGTSLDEAKQIKYKVIKGLQIAFINVSENEWSTTSGNEAGANPLDEVGNYYQIKEAKLSASFVILIVHGGHENYGLPSPRMKKLYRYFINLGVDVVIGHHTHCFSGHEIYSGKLIVYSLGNFLFDNHNYRNNTSWNIGCAITLIITGNRLDFKLHPFHQCNENVGIQLFNSDELKLFKQEAEAKTNIIQSDEMLQIEYQAFLKKQNNMYLSFLEPINNKYILMAMNRGIFPRFIKKYQKRLLFNLIRCEAHRDVVLSILSKNEN
jgi:poly-gamma-glutamate capsule biosynthesis protein CapA/YwtB (metallophosphatase superfamily)